MRMQFTQVVSAQRFWGARDVLSQYFGYSRAELRHAGEKHFAGENKVLQNQLTHCTLRLQRIKCATLSAECMHQMFLFWITCNLLLRNFVICYQSPIARSWVSPPPPTCITDWKRRCVLPDVLCLSQLVNARWLLSDVIFVSEIYSK